MPLKKGNTNIGAIYKGTTQIAKVYKGTKLLFENAKWLDYLFEHIYHSLIPTTISGKTVQDKAKLTKISGNGVVENQQFQIYSTDQTRTLNGITMTDNRDGSYTFNGTATSETILTVGGSIPTINIGDKYLVFGGAKGGSSTTYFLTQNSSGAKDYGNGAVYTQPDNQYGRFLCVVIRNGVTVNNLVVKPQHISLTQWYPFNTPTTLTDNRIQALLNRGYIPYNTGSYKNSKVGEIETFDSSNQLLGTITLPGLLDLNGAINSHDTFEITKTDYVFTRNIGVVDMGDLSWTYQSDNGKFYTNGIQNNIKLITNNAIIPNMLSNKYVVDAYGNVVANSRKLYESTDGLLFYYTNDSTDIPSGTLYYELATPQFITIPKKHLGCVDLGSLNWNVDTQGGKTIFNAYLSGGLGSQTSDGIANIYCSKYVSSSLNGLVSNDKQIRAFYASSSNPCQLGVYDSAYTSAADFKSAMAGQYLFYETENEVSDFDNIAQINAGGSITSNSEVLPNVNFEIKCK